MPLHGIKTSQTLRMRAGGLANELRQLTMSSAHAARQHAGSVEGANGNATSSNGQHTNAAQGCAHAHDEATREATRELTQAEWQAACAEATGVLQDAIEGINDAMEELRYEMAELQGEAC